MMETKSNTDRAALEESVAQAEERLQTLQDELQALPQREVEAVEADKQAHSKKHQAWIRNGKQGARPAIEHPRLRAVHKREQELRREIPLANLELHEARMRLLAHQIAELKRSVESDREALGRLIAKRDQLDAEIAQVQSRISQAIDGRNRQLDIAYYAEMNEANSIKSRLEKR